MAVVGLILYLPVGHHIMGIVVWCLAAVVLGSGLRAPRVFQAIEAFGAWFGRVVGTGLTWLLLAPFYYVVFSAGRLLLLLAGKDPMHRKWPSDEKTYWVPRPPVPSMEQYKKQH